MSYPKLTRTEEDLMQLLWKQKEPSTVSQLISQMEEPHPPHSTISSIIRILEKKKFVNHKTYGRTHAYFPLILKNEYTRFSIKRIIGDYFKGSPNELVSFLIKENDLSLKDLSRILTKLENEEE